MKYLFNIIFLFFNISCSSQNQQPNNLKPMYGEVLVKSEAFKKADEAFIKESVKNFGSIDSAITVYTDHAWRYYYNNSLETAMKRFNQVWLLNSNFPDSYFGFASLLESNGNFDEAKRFYKLASEKDLNNERSEICFQRIADCKEKLGDIKGTYEAYLKITLLNPENSFAYKKLGYFSMTLKKMDEALQAYNKAIRLDPQDEVTYNNMAYLFHSIGEHEQAVKKYSKAIELNPNYISALANRGICFSEINDLKKAKLDFEKCVSLDPNSKQLRDLLNQVKLKLKN